jgi:hypothetical protein
MEQQTEHLMVQHRVPELIMVLRMVQQTELQEIQEQQLEQEQLEQEQVQLEQEQAQQELELWVVQQPVVPEMEQAVQAQLLEQLELVEQPVQEREQLLVELLGNEKNDRFLPVIFLTL